jgi:hypothetical protein
MFKITYINTDEYWQIPAKTELFAFNKIKEYELISNEVEIEYIGFPWATLIDFLQTGKVIPLPLLNEYNKIKSRKRIVGKTITVCQHIYCARYMNIFKEVGITDIFWPHANFKDMHQSVVSIHPFPLYPVITPNENYDKNKLKDILYSFIGAYDPKYYQTDIRKKIFESVDKNSSRYIVERKNWHYASHVYKKQINNIEIDKNEHKIINQDELEYSEVLSRSIFSLCPSGSGPNSIRLWESLAFGSIPVIFKDNIQLPGKYSEWQNAALFFSENEKGLNNFISFIHKIKDNNSLLENMQSAGKEIYKKYGTDIFIYDILNFINKETKKESYFNKKIIEPVKSLIIIDPGLKDVGSHHHHINYNIHKKISSKVNIIVLANIKFNSEVSYKSKNIFKNSIYDYNYKNYSNPNFHALTYSMEILKEFKNYNKEISLYVHTCTLPLILGISFVIDKIIDQIDTFYIELMFLPNGYEPYDNKVKSDLNNYLYVQALDKITVTFMKNFKNLKISTSNQYFKNFYQEIFKKIKNKDIFIDVHPHVMLTDDAFSDFKIDKTLSKLNGINVLLHAGDPRPGKGLQWIKDNITDLINLSNQEVSYHIHLNKIRFPDDYLIEVEIISWLKRFSTSNPRLIIHSIAIDEDKWFNFLSLFDYFIIPNEPNFYSYKTSGIVFDAIFSIGSPERVFIFENTMSYKILLAQSIYISKIENFSKDVLNLTRKNSSVNRSLLSNVNIFNKSHAEYAAAHLDLI